MRRALCVVLFLVSNIEHGTVVAAQSWCEVNSLIGKQQFLPWFATSLSRVRCVFRHASDLARKEDIPRRRIYFQERVTTDFHIDDSTIRKERPQLDLSVALVRNSALFLRCGGDEYYDDSRGYQYNGDGNRRGIHGTNPQYYEHDDNRQWDDDYDDYYGRGNPTKRRHEYSYEKGDEEYYERYSTGAKPRAKTQFPPLGDIPSMSSSLLTQGNRKIGMVCCVSGALLTVLGISLFFNKALLRLGNLAFIIGFPLFIGPGRTAGYFLQPKKARATGCLTLGIFLVLLGRPILGMVLEIFGLLNLFGNMFPVVLAVLRTMPVVGDFIPSGSGSRRKKDQRAQPWNERDDYYYEDAGRQQQDDVERYY